MNIVVVGLGKFGKELVSLLSKENHNIIAIDNDKELVKDVTDEYNVVGFYGNGASYDCLKEAGAKGYQLLVSCTGNDEVNILSCAVAKALDVKNTIARIKNKEYSNQIDVMSKEFGISLFINSDFDTAKEIFRTICFPGAIKVETFAKGRVDIVEVKIEEDSPLLGCELKDIKSKYQFASLVCAINRNDEIIIPSGNDLLEAGDYAYICGSPKELVRNLKAIKAYKNKQNSVILIGASEISGYLTELLYDGGFDVTVVEREKEEALRFSSEYLNAITINGDGTNFSLLEQEGLKNSALVTLTGIDETNIVISSMALKQGSPKVITKVSNKNLDTLLEDNGLDSVVCPKEVFASCVLRYIRSIENNKPSLCKSLYMLVGGKVEALEFEVLADTKYTNIPLKDLNIKKGYLISTIIRNGNVIVPTGNDSILKSDSVIIVTKEEGTKDLSEIFN